MKRISILLLSSCISICFISLSSCQFTPKPSKALPKNARYSETYKWVIDKIRYKIMQNNANCKYQSISWENMVSYPNMNDKSYGNIIEKDNHSTYYMYDDMTVISVEHSYRLSDDIEENLFRKAFYIYPINGVIEEVEPRYKITPENEKEYEKEIQRILDVNLW